MENIYPESIGVSSEVSEEYILQPAWSNHDQTSEISSDSGSHSNQSSRYFQSSSNMTFGQTGRPPREPDSALSPEELTRRNRRRARNREAACRQRDRRLGNELNIINRDYAALFMLHVCYFFKNSFGKERLRVSNFETTNLVQSVHV